MKVDQIIFELSRKRKNADGWTDGQPKNIMPPAPAVQSHKKEKKFVIFFSFNVYTHAVLQYQYVTSMHIYQNKICNQMFWADVILGEFVLGTVFDFCLFFYSLKVLWNCQIYHVWKCADTILILLTITNVAKMQVFKYDAEYKID